MRHQIFKDGLDGINSDSEFFNKYMGAKLIDILNNNEIYKNRSQESISLNRKIVELFALHCPQFDHVIRKDTLQPGKLPADVNGKLLMYFGVQSPLHGAQSQFLALALGDINGYTTYTFYIAGSGDPQILSSMANNSDITKRINKLKIGTMEEFQANKEKISEAASYFNDISKSLKNNMLGFTPKKCMELSYQLSTPSIDKRMYAAQNSAFDFWKSIGDVNLKKAVKDNKESYVDFVNLIFSGYETKDAFEEIFGIDVVKQQY